MEKNRSSGEPLSRRAFVARSAALGGITLAAAPTRGEGGESDVPAAPGPRTVAEVRPVIGTPTLVIDGAPYGPMFYTLGGRDRREPGEMAARNFRVYFVMVHDVGWPGDQAAALDHLDVNVRRVLAEIPNARIVLRLYVCNPRHFARDYPDEVMAFNDGQARHFTKWYNMAHVPTEERGYSSFASRVWREKTSEALASYVAHVLGSDYAASVIGYFLGGGGTEEWYYYENFDESKYCLDFSRPMKAAFREFLRREYGGDVERLRAAWGDPTADFATAEPPDVRSRFTADAGVFWDPVGSRRVRDYFYVHNKVMEDAILEFARVVKRACDRRQVVGLFYGSLQNMWLVKGGQATFKDLLNSPDVDFFSAPPQYNRRGAGEHGCIRFLNASLKRHGKMWVSESDIRTVCSREDPGNPAADGRTQTVADSLACLEREFAHLLCEGAGGWWLQPGSGDYRDLEILALFDRIQHLGEAAVRFDRTSDTDVAAVVDQESLLTGPAFSFTPSIHLVLPCLLDAFRVEETCRIGTPVDYYELDDVLAPGARRYKLYLMLNCFRLSDEERRRIDGLRRGGATLVWMYAPGLFNPDRTPELSPDHARDLLGFTLGSEVGEALRVSMRLTDEGAEYFEGVSPRRVFGDFERPRWVKDARTGGIGREHPGRVRLRQRFHGAGGGEVLARFEDGGRPSIVMRRSPEATDVWIGSVMAPADLLRGLARRAGCHLFCEDDEIVYANRSFLAIHTGRPGRRTFHLRRRSDVVEMFSGETLGRGVTRFDDRIDAFRTRLYYLGDRALWDRARRDSDSVFERFQGELRRLRAASQAGGVPAKPRP